jgi:hypothetical protein
MMKSRIIAGIAIGSFSLAAIGVSSGVVPSSVAVPAESAENEAILKTVDALYGVISGGAGEERDWKAFHALFAENGRLTSFARGEDAGWVLRIMSADDYEEGAKAWFANTSFQEQGIHNEIDVFGNIAHVFSTYESLVGEGEPDRKPEMRGINSIQLVKTGDSWKVLSIVWDTERPNNPIPARYDAASDG